ncbi:ubiquitin C-terminal hydrolase 12-like [Telopea speciosissima]|uniref:ubiquitin C-terminal hydrolase 12-like n=1 Tax=Telopea speciosissima TaxID=54955 RepID=UPI001CC599EA|nr:ubiquitin C-terminal hydrolase 12-like [Telopea speciosissima]
MEVPSFAISKKASERCLVSSAPKVFFQKRFKHITSLDHVRLGNGTAGHIAFFLLKVTALEIVRRFSKAKCPFLWSGLGALQLLCYPPFKWIQRWSLFRGLVKGMQALSRPFLLLSITTALSERLEYRETSDHLDGSQECTEPDSEESIVDTGSNLRRKRSSVPLPLFPVSDAQQEDAVMLVVSQSPFANRPQPMEVVAQGETVGTVEDQPGKDPLSWKFRWTIKNFARLKAMKHYYSDIFSTESYKWRVLIYVHKDYLSMHLEVADLENLRYRWSRWTQFSFSVINELYSNRTVRYETHHLFQAQHTMWGFRLFKSWSNICDIDYGYIKEGIFKVEIEVAVKAVDYFKYNSKVETGYVGLESMLPLYMNSLLQTLYHIPFFRKVVYRIHKDMSSWNIPQAMQCLFYMLQYSNNSVDSRTVLFKYPELDMDCDTHPDVLEIFRDLCQNLEDQMEGTAEAGSIKQLFVGRQINRIECFNVNHTIDDEEHFYGLRLDVKGCQDVHASFQKYLQVECLEGDKMYHSEQYGLQVANKRFLFLEFPPVLLLQLKRLKYDYLGDPMEKIKDHYAYPLELDLDQYLSPEVDRSVSNIYELQSVLVYSDSESTEDYYAIIRPTHSDEWFKFYDNWVTKIDVERALDEQFGGSKVMTNPCFNNTPLELSNSSYACMLVYIRKSDKEKIICNVDEKDIAAHYRVRLKKELKEREEKGRKSREKKEGHLYTVIKVAQNADLIKQIGREIYFGLVDYAKVQSFHIQNQLPFFRFKEEVAEVCKIPVPCQRFWLWAMGQDGTYRTRRPLTCQEEQQSLGQLRELSNEFYNVELKLFLEVELDQDLHPVPLPDKTEHDILLFFKLYDPEKEEIRYVGRLIVEGTGMPVDILTKLNKMAGFASNVEIELYEEIKFEYSVKCKHIDKKLSFQSSQIKDGAIICFQMFPPFDSFRQCQYPDVPSFLEYVHNVQGVHFLSLRHPNDDIYLKLSKLSTYDDIVQRLAPKIKLDDPSKIRLASYKSFSEQPHLEPFDYHAGQHLSDMLDCLEETSDILYYEVLKKLELAFHSTVKSEVVIHSIRFPIESTVADLLVDLGTKVELSSPNAKLRLLDVSDHKISAIFLLDQTLECINDKLQLRVEEIPEEEKHCGPQNCLIRVYHFTKDTSQNLVVQNFGDPFLLIIHKAETLAKIKVHIQKKVQVPGEEFVKVSFLFLFFYLLFICGNMSYGCQSRSFGCIGYVIFLRVLYPVSDGTNRGHERWKFAVFLLGCPKYLEDSDIVSNHFQTEDICGDRVPYLGLEHSDSTSGTGITEVDAVGSTRATIISEANAVASMDMEGMEGLPKRKEEMGTLKKKRTRRRFRPWIPCGCQLPCFKL